MVGHSCAPGNDAMRAIRSPLILYIPGLLPKPEPAVHKDALFRCLFEGVRRNDPEIAAQIAGSSHSFDLVSWTYDFYREHRDFTLDADAVEAVIARPEPDDRDIEEATGLARRILLTIYRFGDRLPFLVPHLATEKMQVHMRDLRRYNHNVNGIADHVREMFKMPLRAAAESGRPVLLLAHSMGSVIAWDSLWEMARVHGDHARVDHWVTMGSPLGQSYLQSRILGRDAQGAERYPDNIRTWTNICAVGELTAIDPTLADDFGEMLELGLVEAITDIDIFNAFRLDGRLNVHAEYGYLAHPTTGRIIADWWESRSR